MEAKYLHVTYQKFYSDKKTLLKLMNAYFYEFEADQAELYEAESESFYFYQLNRFRKPVEQNLQKKIKALLVKTTYVEPILDYGVNI